MSANDPKRRSAISLWDVTQGTLPIRLSDILLECRQWPSLRRVAMERREFIKIVSGLVGTWPTGTVLARADKVIE
jgi:hypothetical protein